jgi:hypothetical protein
MKSHKVGGNVVQSYYVYNEGGRLNISENDLGEVEMALEGLDMTNGP